MQDNRRARFTQELLGEIRRLKDGSAEPAAAAGADKARVLVVDDDFASTMALEALLVAEGFDVDTATNGAHALERIAQRTPRVILTDVRMPEMDGNELCRRLAEDPATRDIPVFVITGYDQALAETAAHASEVLRKPVDTERVISLLRLRTA